MFSRSVFPNSAVGLSCGCLWAASYYVRREGKSSGELDQSAGEVVFVSPGGGVESVVGAGQVAVSVHSENATPGSATSSSFKLPLVGAPGARAATYIGLLSAMSISLPANMATAMFADRVILPICDVKTLRIPTTRGFLKIGGRD
jgi:hypothetical protein